MHIVLYETVHFENIVPLLRLFNLPGNRITIFCDEQAFAQARAQLGSDVATFEWVLQKKKQARRLFLNEAKKYLRREQVELLYINTLSDNFFHLVQLIRSQRDMRTIATIHAINSYFSPQLTFNLRRIVRVSGKWMLRRTIREYSVQSASLLPAARRLVDPRYAVHVIPGAVYEEKQAACPPLPLHLVIAGSVDARRRNYEEADALILLLEKKQIPVQITFLGGTATAYGQQKVREWLAMPLQYVKLKYYETDLVAQTEYDRVLTTAHFIYHPSSGKAVLEDGSVETYGETVCSGIFSDAIRHARPLILPATLSTDPAFENCSFRYNNPGEIGSFLESLYTSPAAIGPWMDEARKTALHFTPEKIRQRNPGVFIAGDTALPASAEENFAGKRSNTSTPPELE